MDVSRGPGVHRTNVTSASSESRLQTWRRRGITLPVLAIVAAVVWSTSPAWLLLSGTVDLVTRRTAWTRAGLFLSYLLFAELAGVLASFGLFTARVVLRRSPEWFLASNVALQSAWASSLLGAARRLYRLSFDVSGDEVTTPGPIVLLCRHVSLGDTVLPATFVTARHGVALRYVLKRELLWDPCLDIVGQRLPNAFVERASKDSTREIEKVRFISRDLGAGEGVLIYPEGTRFSPARRERVIAKLDERGDETGARRARALRNVLPPQLGGTLAALDEARDADVVVCAHSGFEGIRTLRQFVDGSFVGRTVYIRFWRIPRGEVPQDENARVDWLFNTWGEVDAWVEAVTSGAVRDLDEVEAPAQLGQ